jgi:hypothetical protein
MFPHQGQGAAFSHAFNCLFLLIVLTCVPFNRLKLYLLTV